jgi:pyruvate dehydrogenase (quinone)
MAQTVAETLVGVLERIGVKQIFALIGDSLNPLADAVRTSSIEWIGVRHEEGAALAASGQAKLTGRLAVCAGTTGPGSTHLVAGLYEAARDHAPVLALSGDMPRKMHGVDYFQTTNPDLLFRDVSLYTETIMSPRQSLRPMRAVVLLISHCRKTSSRHGPTAALPAWILCNRAQRSRRMRRT